MTLSRTEVINKVIPLASLIYRIVFLRFALVKLIKYFEIYCINFAMIKLSPI